MALSDAQIERFSRQIVLPQIGGRGQQRLLAATVAIGGAGEVAAIAARYLAGAGIGHLVLHGAARADLRAALTALDPELRVTLSDLALGGMAAEVLVAGDLSLAELDCAAAAEQPLVAGGSSGGVGWLVVAPVGGACASCAARAARQIPPGPPFSKGGLMSPTSGVVASLIAVEVIKVLLALRRETERTWLQFDAATSTLVSHPIATAADCPRCAAA